MHKQIFRILMFAVLATGAIVLIPGTNWYVHSQGRGAITPEIIARRKALEKELQSIALVERSS